MESDMKTMDHRIARRRRQISEDRARRRLPRIIVFLVLLAVGAFGVWLVQSPVLAVREVEVSGAAHSDPEAIGVAEGLVVGTPTIGVPAERIEAALRGDPWIADARVSVTWPGYVLLEVIEHDPVAYIDTGDAWLWATADGHVVQIADVPVTGWPVVEVPISAVVGDRATDPVVLGGLEFVSRLPSGLAADALLMIEDGEVVGWIGGHKVRLGLPREMAEKAAVLVALLDTGLPPRARIDLVSPERPAVTT